MPIFLLPITGGLFLAKYLSKILWDTSDKGLLNDNFVDQAIVKKFGNVQRYVMNPHYNLYRDAQFARFISTDTTNEETYSDKFNCVVFSLITMAHARMVLKNCAFGMVFTKSHVVNCYVSENGELVTDEPQSDKQVELTGVEFVLI